MARAYLIIIVIGAIIGTMLPSGSPRPADAGANAPAPTHIVSRAAVSDAPESPIAGTPAMGGPWVRLERGRGGHFFADAQVNGMTVHFLIDTGATGVALTTEDAQRVGLQFSPMEFTAVGRGASGDVRGKQVILDRVSLGGREVEAVEGAIIEGGDISLLGQSFLSKMGTIEISGDQMTIR